MSTEGGASRVKGAYRWIAVAFPLAAIAGAVVQVFRLSVFGEIFVDIGFLYYMLAFSAPLAFFYFPLNTRAPHDRIPWYDVTIAAGTFGILFYLFLRARSIAYEGWESQPPAYVIPMVMFVVLSLMESARRTAGLAVVIVCGFFAIYPLFAAYMPGPLQGLSLSFVRVFSYHVLGSDGIIGIPVATISKIVVGFLLFAVALQVLGGGQFFLNIAIGALGHVRGAAAKVSVVASALFGMMSGSPSANVITTGVFTIPAMKKTGYPPHYAGAVETCASTGGTFMPPVMGATAFIMAEFLGVPYATVMVAAFPPALLYYLALFLQADCYAAKSELKGLPRGTLLPSFGQTMKQGWFYIVGLLVLLFAMLAMLQERQSPYYGVVALFILAAIRKDTRPSLKTVIETFERMGKLLAGLLPMCAVIGLIVGSLFITGAASSLAVELRDLAGGNVYLLLIFAMIAMYVLGMGISMTAIYIVAAVLVAPALVQGGLNQLAVHMFILFSAGLSHITPPVGLASFAL